MGGCGAGTCSPPLPNRKAVGRGPIGGAAGGSWCGRSGAAGAQGGCSLSLALCGLSFAAGGHPRLAARGATGARGEDGAAVWGRSRGERREEEAGVQSLAGEGRAGGG